MNDIAHATIPRARPSSNQSRLNVEISTQNIVSAFQEVPVKGPLSLNAAVGNILSLERLPEVPDDLRMHLGTYIQRARELSDKDPVMSYWCLYFSAKRGVNVKATRTTQTWLYRLMDSLELVKRELRDHESVASEDSGRVYVESFAAKILSIAEAEEQAGNPSRSTARKFLAAANFFEMLTVFTPIGDHADIQERIKHCKVKASSIVRDVRDGQADDTSGPSDSTSPRGGGALTKRVSDEALAQAASSAKAASTPRALKRSSMPATALASKGEQSPPSRINGYLAPPQPSAASSYLTVPSPSTFGTISLPSSTSPSINPSPTALIGGMPLPVSSGVDDASRKLTREKNLDATLGSNSPSPEGKLSSPLEPSAATDGIGGSSAPSSSSPKAAPTLPATIISSTRSTPAQVNVPGKIGFFAAISKAFSGKDGLGQMSPDTPGVWSNRATPGTEDASFRLGSTLAVVDAKENGSMERSPFVTTTTSGIISSREHKRTLSGVQHRPVLRRSDTISSNADSTTIPPTSSMSATPQNRAAGSPNTILTPSPPGATFGSTLPSPSQKVEPLVGTTTPFSMSSLPTSGKSAPTPAIQSSGTRSEATFPGTKLPPSNSTKPSSLLNSMATAPRRRFSVDKHHVRQDELVLRPVEIGSIPLRRAHSNDEPTELVGVLKQTSNLEFPPRGTPIGDRILALKKVHFTGSVKGGLSSVASLSRPPSPSHNDLDFKTLVQSQSGRLWENFEPAESAEAMSLKKPDVVVVPPTSSATTNRMAASTAAQSTTPAPPQTQQHTRSGSGNLSIPSSSINTSHQRSDSLSSKTSVPLSAPNVTNQATLAAPSDSVLLKSDRSPRRFPQSLPILIPHGRDRAQSTGYPTIVGSAGSFATRTHVTAYQRSRTNSPSVLPGSLPSTSAIPSASSPSFRASLAVPPISMTRPPNIQQSQQPARAPSPSRSHVITTPATAPAFLPIPLPNVSKPILISPLEESVLPPEASSVSISPPPAMSAVANRTQTPFSRSIDLPSSPPTDIVYNARKHTKYAMSALEFDDVETARRELKAALSTLGLY